MAQWLKAGGGIYQALQQNTRVRPGIAFFIAVPAGQLHLLVIGQS